MLHYKLVKIIIDVPSFAKVIIDIVIKYNSSSNPIVTDLNSLFISIFWFLLYYFLKTKQKPFTDFYSQTNS